MTDLGPRALFELAGRLYADGPPLRRRLQIWRPFICPFGPLIKAVPQGARVLDIGCGAGLFLGLLAGLGRISYGLGFDSSADAIALALTMRSRLAGGPRLDFRHRSTEEPWPEEQFDAVSVIDLIHHVPPARQASVLKKAAERVRPGGVLIYKDMADRPAWQVLTSRLHDLVFSRQWVHLPSFRMVSDCLKSAGLKTGDYARQRILWYGHETAVFHRTAG